MKANGSTEAGVHVGFDAFPTQAMADKIRNFDSIPDIMTMEIPPVEWLVDDMIATKTMTLWTGTDGTAKTFLAQKMAIAVASGLTFLGRRCQRSPVLYLDFENPSFVVRERFDLMAGGGPIPNLKVWGTWLAEQPPQIGNELLLTIASETKPLIIIDPFVYAHGADENSSTEMSGVMQCLRYCAAAGGAVIVVHHPAKTEGSMGRGSSAIKGATDVAYLQEMNADGLITLTCVKNRFGERHSVTILPDYDEGTFTVTDSPQFTKRADDIEKLRRIIEENPGLTQNAIFKKSTMKKSRLVALLKTSPHGLWEERKEGQAFRYFPPVPTVENLNPLGNRFAVGNRSGTGQFHPVEKSADKLFPCEGTGRELVVPDPLFPPL